MPFAIPTPMPMSGDRDEGVGHVRQAILHQYRRAQGQPARPHSGCRKARGDRRARAPAAWWSRSAHRLTRRRRGSASASWCIIIKGCTSGNHCRGGWQQLCRRLAGKVLWQHAHGGHAQYLKVPANTGAAVRMSCRFRQGLRSPAAPGNAYSALRRMNLSGNDTLAIFARARSDWRPRNTPRRWGAKVIALDISPQAAGARESIRRRSCGQPGSNDPSPRSRISPMAASRI